VDSVTAQTTAVLVAIIGLLGVVVQTLRTRGGPTWQSTIQSELEILKALPDGAARDQFQRYIEHKITERTQAELVRRRDSLGMTLALFLVAIAVVVGVGAWTAGGWWNLLQLLTLVLGGFGLVGFAESVAKVERDEKGVRVASSGRAAVGRGAEHEAARPAAERGHAPHDRAEPGP
jgi:hypothetical protein